MLDRDVLQALHGEWLLPEPASGRRRAGVPEQRLELFLGDRLGILEGEDRGALQNVLELADVSGKRVAEQKVHRGASNGDLPAIAAGEPADEVLRQDEHVFWARAERRDLDHDGGDAEVEVFAELLGPERPDWAVRGGDDAHVDLD